MKIQPLNHALVQGPGKTMPQVNCRVVAPRQGRIFKIPKPRPRPVQQPPINLLKRFGSSAKEKAAGSRVHV